VDCIQPAKDYGLVAGYCEYNNELSGGAILPLPQYALRA